MHSHESWLLLIVLISALALTKYLWFHANGFHLQFTPHSRVATLLKADLGESPVANLVSEYRSPGQYNIMRSAAYDVHNVCNM